MSFISSYLLRNLTAQKPLLALPAHAKTLTKHTISSCKSQIENISSKQRPNFQNPNPILTLRTIDKVSNDLCKIIDSAQIVYTQYTGGLQTATTQSTMSTRRELQESMSSCIDEISQYFVSLNHDPNLLAVLETIENSPNSMAQFDFEDKMLLQSLLRQLRTEQMQSEGNTIHNKLINVQTRLQREFIENNRKSRPIFSITPKQFKSIPIKAFIKKYKDKFSDQEDQENIPVELQLENISELDVLKFSSDAQVRFLYFQQYCRACSEENTPLILELCNQRLDVAKHYGEHETFWKLQARKNLLEIGDMRQKINKIREVIKQQTIKDLDVIQKITGVQGPIRYWDMAYLKEQIKLAILATEKRNIQMLTCFSLENVLNGLHLLVSQYFGFKCKLKTVIVDAETGDILDHRFDKTLSVIQMDHINEEKFKNQVVYFIMEIEDRGTIIMDMFRRPSKFNKFQVSTLTEVGASSIQNQQAVAYVVDSMDKDAMLLGFSQVKTIFHEFGHALNIALSATKYQYHSCARASMDIAEIPSHFAELFLRDYNFVKNFALKPEPVKKKDGTIGKEPIDQDIFKKMLFCDEIFRFMQFEETLMFTSLDIDLNSFSPADLSKNNYSTDHKLQKQDLLEICQRNLMEAFTCDRQYMVNEVLDSGNQKEKTRMKASEIEFLIDQVMFNREKLHPMWEQIRQVLMNDDSTIDDEIYETVLPGKNDQDQQSSEAVQIKEQDDIISQQYKDMPIYSRFNHIFDYEGNYHSYVVAQILSQHLYYKNKKLTSQRSEKVSSEIKDIYSKGGAFDYNSMFKSPY